MTSLAGAKDLIDGKSTNPQDIGKTSQSGGRLCSLIFHHLRGGSDSEKLPYLIIGLATPACGCACSMRNAEGEGNTVSQNITSQICNEWGLPFPYYFYGGN